MSAIDVILRVEPWWPREGPRWRVEAESVVPRARAIVDPLRDDEVRTLPHVPDDVATWSDLCASLSPGGAWTPPLQTLRAIGRLLRKRLLTPPEIAGHLAAVEAQANAESRLLRFLFETVPSDGDGFDVLSSLPFELVYDDQRFVFKQPGHGVLRCDGRAGARNLVRPMRGRALIATAHAEGREPSQARLATHASAVAAAVEAMGWEPALLPDATPIALERALTEGKERIDLLCVACHGLADPSYAGRLVLREGSVTGAALGQWLEEATRQRRQVGAALLCACSSAAPDRGEDTSGMAAWLALDKRAHAALGFRGPVQVEWALGFVQKMFEKMQGGDTVESAFVKVRAAVLDEEPQWTLPLLYVQRSDPGQPELTPAHTRTTKGLEHVVTPCFDLSPPSEEDLATLSPGDQRALAMIRERVTEQSSREIAQLLGEPEPQASARLLRLSRLGLLSYDERGLYAVRR